ncbi:MAG: pilus assembly protein [Acidobacteria bacterium]|nr:pilus assembly protein [Acidobacteriota bacterium]
MRRLRSERGTALVEAAVTVPILLLIAVGVFEFGRAFQTWEVLTNAAREGARLSVLPNSTNSAVDAVVRNYMQTGQLAGYSSASVSVNRSATLTVNGQPLSASQVTVGYPYTFMVLQPVARLITPSSTTGQGITITATAIMRNETQ